jgi:hypothetical protein
MAYNLYVIGVNLIVSVVCSAVALLLLFQLRQEPKARLFFVLMVLQSMAAFGFALSRIAAALGSDFLLPFYVATVIYAEYPTLLLSFAAEYFEIWTPFRRRLARVLFALPAAVAAFVLFNGFFRSVSLSESGSFLYPFVIPTVILISTGEMGIL